VNNFSHLDEGGKSLKICGEKPLLDQPFLRFWRVSWKNAILGGHFNFPLSGPKPFKTCASSNAIALAANEDDIDDGIDIQWQAEEGERSVAN